MRAAAPLAAILALAAPALAACPIELAVYEEPDTGASLNFRPAGPGVVSNAFRLGLESDGLLEAVVLWSDDPGRPVARIMRDCPEGDVTGDELAACAIWQGVIYALGADRAIGLLPHEGSDAPQALLLPDLARSIAQSGLNAASSRRGLPWEVFSMSGCQE